MISWNWINYLQDGKGDEKGSKDLPLRITKLFVHPIKSCKGTSVPEARYTPEGIEYDRKLMICDAKTHVAITARDISKMLLINPQVHVDENNPYGGWLEVSFPEDSGCEAFRVPLNPSQQLLESWPLVDDAKVWSSNNDAHVVQSIDPDAAFGPDTPSETLSTFLGRNVFLVRKGPRQRFVAPTKAFPHLKANAAFHDGYPILIATDASCDDVGRRIRASATNDATAEDAEKRGIWNIHRLNKEVWRDKEFVIERFRPNIVINAEGLVPYDEERWEEVEVGERGGKILVVSRCHRCQIPNLDVETAESDSSVPSQVLTKYRREDLENPMKTDMMQRVQQQFPPSQVVPHNDARPPGNSSSSDASPGTVRIFGYPPNSARSAFYPINEPGSAEDEQTLSSMSRSFDTASRSSSSHAGGSKGSHLHHRRDDSVNLVSRTSTATCSTSSFTNHLSMRSLKGMQGLLEAELGGSTVELDPYSNGTGSGFKTGQPIAPVLVSKFSSTTASSSSSNGPPNARRRARSATYSGTSLSRNNTLFHEDSSPSRRAAELKSLLGTSGRRVSAKVLFPPTADGSTPRHRKSASTTDLPGTLSLEKAKSKARVEIDIVLESDTVVEGGYLRGRMEVTIRKATKHESPIWVGSGKMRIVGFEALPNDKARHTFYQYAEDLASITSVSHLMLASTPDSDGYGRVKEGIHVLPFAMKIPIGGSHGVAKGVLQSRSGAVVQYIAMGSVKIKDPTVATTSIAHFYRNIEVHPFLGQSILAPSEQPLRTANAQSLFMGGSGKLQLTATLHRHVWVAGQRCYVHVDIKNDTSKKVKTLTLTLCRTTTLFQPRSDLDASVARSPGSADIDACETSTTKKDVAQCTLEMGQKGEKGYVTAKGFWTGVDPNSVVELSHFLLIPPDALSIPRGRLIEVDYRIRIAISAGTLSSDVTVSLPIRIINFLSIDPPPTFASLTVPPLKPVSTQDLRAPNFNRRRSLSMDNLQDHEEQLKLWEANHGPRSDVQQHPLSLRQLPDRPVQPQNSSHTLPRSAQRPPPLHNFATIGHRGQQPPFSAPPDITRSQPSRIPAVPLPTSSLRHSRSREMGRSQGDSTRPNIARSKTVAFVDDQPPRDRRLGSERGGLSTTHPKSKQKAISTALANPLFPDSQRAPRPVHKQERVFDSPAEMVLTASAAADDELSESDYEGGDLPYLGDYRRVNPRQPQRIDGLPSNSYDHASRPLDKDLGGPSPISDIPSTSHNRTGQCCVEEGNDSNHSFETEEMIRAVDQIAKEDYLPDTTLPVDTSLDTPYPGIGTPRPAPPFPLHEHRRQLPSTDMSYEGDSPSSTPTRPEVNRPIARSYIIAGPRPPQSSSHNRTRSVTQLQSGIPMANRSSSSLSVNARLPRLRTVGHPARSQSYDDQGVMPLAQLELPHTGAAGLISNAATLLPSVSTTGGHSSLYGLARDGSSGFIPSTSPESSHRKRANHRSNHSLSSISTETSDQTRTSGTSSSRDVPCSVRSKIAQLEARNRALKAISSYSGSPGSDNPVLATLMRQSTSTYGHPSPVSPSKAARGETLADDAASMGSTDSRCSEIRRNHDDIQREAVSDGFYSPIFRKSHTPGKWVAELKGK
ncbi:hypothetical protein FRB99_005033 [Tulasnella sp. 403]|nr:hypothetical protein FRB99_005033 [Tulasnella sp. 403]